MIIALPFSWVAFEEPGFCGETYILEKGLYGCQEDWGALQPRVASAMPVVLVRDSHEYISQLYKWTSYQTVKSPVNS